MLGRIEFAALMACRFATTASLACCLERPAIHAETIPPAVEISARAMCVKSLTNATAYRLTGGGFCVGGGRTMKRRPAGGGATPFFFRM